MPAPVRPDIDALTSAVDPTTVDPKADTLTSAVDPTAVDPKADALKECQTDKEASPLDGYSRREKQKQLSFIPTKEEESTRHPVGLGAAMTISAASPLILLAGPIVFPLLLVVPLLSFWAPRFFSKKEVYGKETEPLQSADGAVETPNSENIKQLLNVFQGFIDQIFKDEFESKKENLDKFDRILQDPSKATEEEKKYAVEKIGHILETRQRFFDENTELLVQGTGISLAQLQGWSGQGKEILRQIQSEGERTDRERESIFTGFTELNTADRKILHDLQGRLEVCEEQAPSAPSTHVDKVRSETKKREMAL